LLLSYLFLPLPFPSLSHLFLPLPPFLLLLAP
jgi:hypothetical protein